jgi:hypothetical protein
MELHNEGDQVGMSKMKMIISTFIAVLALGALVSSTASAVTPGWLVNGTLLTGDQKAALATTAAVDQNGVLRFKEIEIECKGSTLDGIDPLIEALHNNLGSAQSLQFLDCEEIAGGCKLENQPVTIGTVPVTTEPTLEGALGVAATFRPISGTTFTTLKFAAGGTCTVAGEKLPVTGTAPATAPTGQDERTLQLLSINVLSSTSNLKVGNSAASLEGSALLKLASSLPWSFM